MRSKIALLVLALLPFLSRADNEVPISISSPDVASTFVFAKIKNHALVWDKKTSTLLARVTAIEDTSDGSMQAEEDTHDFRLPGVTFDATRQLYVALSAKGEVIPIARPKKILFVSSIEPLPNARVRIFHDHGSLSVILEAIRPDDPAMHPKPELSARDGTTHPVDLDQILR